MELEVFSRDPQDGASADADPYEGRAEEDSRGSADRDAERESGGAERVEMDSGSFPAMEQQQQQRGGDSEESTVPLMLGEAESSSGNANGTDHDGSGLAGGGFFTAEDAIEYIGFGRFQVGMVVYTGLTWLADAAEMILLSFIGPAAKCEWRLSPVQEGAISSAVFVGILLGAYVWGILSDLRGRRFSFLATALFTTVFGLLSAWSPTFWILLLSRTLVGFGLGGASVAFSLCMEFLPEKGRGFWLVFLEAFWTVGSIAEALLAWMIIPNVNWRWLVAVSALPFVFLLVFYPVLPESPRYLMAKGDEEGAMKVLRRIAKFNGKSLPHGMLTSFLPSDLVRLVREREQSAKLPSDLEPVQTRKSAENGSQASVGPLQTEHAGFFSPMKLLFSPELRKTTLLLWFMFFANAFTYYGLVLLTTELQVKGDGHACDDSSKTAVYATQCHADNKPIIETAQYRTVLITCLAEVPGLIVACLVVEKFGRKISIASLLIACGAFMLPLMTILPEVATNVLMFGARSSIMGAFSVLWAYAPELYSTKVRSTGVGAANSGGKLGGFLCPFVAVGFIQSCHRILAVGLFAFVPVLAAVATFFFPKETTQYAKISKRTTASH